MSELVTASYRLTEDTKNKIKQLLEEDSCTASILFNRLVDQYELSRKGEQTKRQEDIARFQSYCDSIVTLYTKAIDENILDKSEADERLKEIMAGHDKALSDCRQKITGLQSSLFQAKEQYERDLTGQKSSIARLEQQLSERTDTSSLLNEAQQENKKLASENASLKAELALVKDQLKESKENNARLMDLLTSLGTGMKGRI